MLDLLRRWCQFDLPQARDLNLQPVVIADRSIQWLKNVCRMTWEALRMKVLVQCTFFRFNTYMAAVTIKEKIDRSFEYNPLMNDLNHLSKS